MLKIDQLVSSKDIKAE